MSSRPLNRRREALRALREIHLLVRALINAWNCGASIRVSQAERNLGITAPTRKREYDELPENDPQRWATLARAMRDIAEAAENLQVYAIRQRAAAERRRARRDGREPPPVVDAVRSL